MTPSARSLKVGFSGLSATLLMLAMLAGPAAAQDGSQDGAQGAANPLAPKTTGPQPTLAPEEEVGKPPPPPNTQEPMEEITVIAPRRVLPDFQSTQEFYQAEFEALRAEYERPAAAPPRAYEVFESGGPSDDPNDRSALRDMVRSAPSIRETLSGGPPKADPTP